MPQPETPAAPESPFLSVVGAAEEGRLRDELDEHLKSIVATLHEQQRNSGGKPKGALTVALLFTLDSGIVEVVAKVKAELPKPARTKSIFFRAADDSLARQNPRQQELPLHETATEGVRDIRSVTSR